ncbi:hypothetical protein DYI37_03020 [Fulvimarina endophytica]|uniref:Uncharacterized protein n=1 Tax=Fulvimarina endophytica TaxID=2293836 RepID=A0A371XB41_9HYPH|nr:hypothetical protein DYI37_03020 [Fulvimarina endophytica]
MSLACQVNYLARLPGLRYAQRMTSKPDPLTGHPPDTLAHLQALKMDITAWCGTHGCGHWRPGRLESLIAHYGPGEVYISRLPILASKMRCDKCGEANVELTISANTQYHRNDK